MDTMVIYNTGDIKLSDADKRDSVPRPTGLSVRQEASGTVVYRPEGLDPIAKPYQRFAMPSPVYSLATDNPDSGRPGRAQFERDLRALLAQTAEGTDNG